MQPETTPEGQAPANVTPQVGTPSTGQAPVTPATTPSTNGPDLEKELAATRKEAADYRTRLRRFEEAQKAADDAKLDELQKAQRRATELEAAHGQATKQLQEMQVRLGVMERATRMGIIDPDAAVRLLDTSEIEYDDKGQPKNIEKLLKALLEARPYLKAPEPSTGRPAMPNLPSTNPSRTQAGNNGTVTVTANQYLDAAFQADFQRTYGMPLLQGVNKGIVKIVG